MIFIALKLHWPVAVVPAPYYLTAMVVSIASPWSAIKGIHF